MHIIKIVCALATVAVSPSNTSISHANYSETSPITFEEIGSLRQISTLHQVNILIDGEKIFNLGADTQNSIQAGLNNLTCSRKSNGCGDGLRSELEKTNSNLEALATIFARKRDRRALIDAVGWVQKKLFGVMDQKDRQKIKTDLSDLHSQQDEIINQTNAGKQLLVEAFESLNATSTITNDIVTKIKEIQDERWNQEAMLENEAHVCQQLALAARTFENTVAALLSLLSTKRITGRIVSFTTMEKSLKALKRTINTQESFPFMHLADITLQKPATITFHHHLIIVRIDVPAVANKRWQAYKVHLNPVIIGERLLMPTNEFEYIAASEGSELTAVKDLTACYTFNDDLFACPLTSPITHINGNSCIEKDFREHATNEESCKKQFHYALLPETAAIRIKHNEVLVITTKQLTVTTTCNSGSGKIVIQSPSTFTADEPCELNIDNIKLLLIAEKTSTAKVKIASSAVINFNPKIPRLPLPDFPHLSTAQIQHVNELGENIKRLNADQLKIHQHIMLDDNSTNYWNLITLTGGCVLIMLLIAFCVGCCCRQ